MRGLDEAGNNLDTAQVSGTVFVSEILGIQMEQIMTRYPNITVLYTTLTSKLYYYDDTGTALLYTETITNGGNGQYNGKPSKTSTAQYNYSFQGWSSKPGGKVESTCRDAVLFDRSVYAVYSATVRTYTVCFYNGSTLLQEVTDVPYGSTASYTGETPVCPDDAELGFDGWYPLSSNIIGDTNCYAQFESPYAFAEITDSWEDIIASIQDGTYKYKYMVGNYKPIENFGKFGTIDMQIAAFNKDKLEDGTSTAAISFIARQSRSYVWPDSGQEFGSTWETSFVRTNMNADAFLDNFPEAVRNSLTSVEKNTAYDKVWMPSSTECASGYYKFLFAEIDERKARFSGNGGGFRNGIRISSDGKYYPGYSWSELGTNSNNTMILGFAIGVTPTE